MTDPQKTIFISYRRKVSSFIARAIFENLRANGYDVFMDVESIDSGTFDTIILNQIQARAHFLVILTPGTLERCSEPGDWLRREIEHAIDHRRNIIPILINDYKFDKRAKKHLTGKLEGLPRLNALTLHHDYFDAAIERLKTRFLKQPAPGDLLTVPAAEQAIVEEKIEELASQPAPTEAELTAEEYFAHAYEKYVNGDFDDAITDFTKVINMKPDYAEAYVNRGVIHQSNGNIDSAITDFNKFISLKPTVYYGYINRGGAHYYKGDWEDAITDYNRAIILAPDVSVSYMGRGSTRGMAGDLIGAIDDFTEAIRLKSDDPYSYGSRAEAYFSLQRHEEALRDLLKANDLLPNDSLTCVALAITHHALGNLDEAHRLWNELLATDDHYSDADWVGKEFNWAPPLVEAARKLIAEL